MDTSMREYQKAIDYIYDLIEQGRLSIGDKLPTERYISETLGMSRNSTREALRTLENMGVIEARHGSGNYLAGNVSQTITKAIDMMLLLRQTNEDEISAFRRSMEVSVCNTIMEQGLGKKWEVQLEEVIERMSQLIQRDTSMSTHHDLSTIVSDESFCPQQILEEQIELDREFHYTLIYATENQFWICIAESIIEVYRRFIDSTLQHADLNARKILLSIHRDILYALQNCDRHACEEAIDRHYNLFSY